MRTRNEIELIAAIAGNIAGHLRTIEDRDEDACGLEDTATEAVTLARHIVRQAQSIPDSHEDDLRCNLATVIALAEQRGDRLEEEGMEELPNTEEAVLDAARACLRVGS